MNKFEQATRMKLRWSYRGLWNVEALWDLSVENLDNIYSDLMQEQRAESQDSLLNHNKENKTLQLKLDIVKYIVQVKLEEQEAQETATKRRQQKQRLLEILAEKQEEGLREMTVEELQERINEL